MNKIESQKERNRERNKQRYHEDEEYRTNKNEKDNRRNKKCYRTDETYIVNINNNSVVMQCEHIEKNKHMFFS